MNHKAPHGHGWLVGIFGIAAGLALIMLFPKLEAVASMVLMVALLHLVGAALVVGSIFSFTPEWFNRLLARFRRHAPEDKTYDFGWSPGATNSPWLATAFFWTVALGLQLEYPSLWPAWFAVSLLGVNAFVGGLVLGSSKRADLAALPMVDLLASDNDLVLDAGCGGGRTTLAISRVLKNGRLVALDRFDAYYISGGGRTHIERNLRIAGLTGRVLVEQGDLTEMSFPEAHFEAAVSTHVIDHLKENKRKGLAEIRRVLKPGGRLLMVVWVPGWITFSLANVFCFMLTSKAGWRKLAGEVGFSIRYEGTINGMWFAVLERPQLSDHDG